MPLALTASHLALSQRHANPQRRRQLFHGADAGAQNQTSRKVIKFQKKKVNFERGQESLMLSISLHLLNRIENRLSVYITNEITQEIRNAACWEASCAGTTSSELCSQLYSRRYGITFELCICETESKNQNM